MDGKVGTEIEKNKKYSREEIVESRDRQRNDDM